MRAGGASRALQGRCISERPQASTDSQPLRGPALVCTPRAHSPPPLARPSLPAARSVLAGGVEELRYTSGGAQAAAGEQPTLAPRLPGVIASTT